MFVSKNSSSKRGDPENSFGTPHCAPGTVTVSFSLKHCQVDLFERSVRFLLGILQDSSSECFKEVNRSILGGILEQDSPVTIKDFSYLAAPTSQNPVQIVLVERRPERESLIIDRRI